MCWSTWRKSIKKICVINIVQGDEKDLEDHNVPLTVDYGRMTTYLYGALKQSIIEIENLKKKNNQLEEINFT